MQSILRGLSVLSLAFLIAGPVTAEDKKEAPKAADKKDAAKAADKKDAPKAAADPVFNIDKRIKLDEKQQAQLDELKKEYGPKLKEIADKINVVMTPERQKIAAETRKTATADGKKGKDLTEAINAALKLNDEETAKLKEAQAARQKLVQEVNKKKMEILTEEQKKTLQTKPKDK